jgi:hypothetical protein
MHAIINASTEHRKISFVSYYKKKHLLFIQHPITRKEETEIDIITIFSSERLYTDLKILRR